MARASGGEWREEKGGGESLVLGAIGSSTLDSQRSRRIPFVTPDMLISKAVRITTSIPLVFKPVVQNNNFYVDEIINNYEGQSAPS